MTHSMQGVSDVKMQLIKLEVLRAGAEMQGYRKNKDFATLELALGYMAFTEWLNQAFYLEENDPEKFYVFKAGSSASGRDMAIALMKRYYAMPDIRKAIHLQMGDVNFERELKMAQESLNFSPVWENSLIRAVIMICRQLTYFFTHAMGYTFELNDKDITLGELNRAAAIWLSEELAKRKTPTSLYIDGVLLNHANDESLNEVMSTVKYFEIYKRNALPYLTKETFRNIPMNDFEGLFEHTIMLAGGRESNFVYRHYKTILVQLAFQIGFLMDRVLPKGYTENVREKMSWLSTIDVTPETKLLRHYFNEHVSVNGKTPAIYNSLEGDEITLWNLDEINHVLSALPGIGMRFKNYIEMS